MASRYGQYGSNGLNADGTLMNCGNKIWDPLEGGRPSIKLFPKYSSGTAMANLLCGDSTESESPWESHIRQRLDAGDACGGEKRKLPVCGDKDDTAQFGRNESESQPRCAAHEQSHLECGVSTTPSPARSKGLAKRRSGSTGGAGCTGPRTPSAVMCNICGGGFGTASIKIHTAQCQKKLEAATSRPPKSPLIARASKPAPAVMLPQTVACPICKCTFGPATIEIHMALCKKKREVASPQKPASKRKAAQRPSTAPPVRSTERASAANDVSLSAAEQSTVEHSGQCSSENIDMTMTEMQYGGLEKNLSFWNRSDEYGFIPANVMKEPRDVSREKSPAPSEARSRTSSLRRRIHSFLDRTPSKTMARVTSTGSLFNSSDSSGSSPLPPLPTANVQQRTPPRQRGVHEAQWKSIASKQDSQNNLADKVEHAKNSMRVKPGELANPWENTPKRGKSATRERSIDRSQPSSPAKRAVARFRRSSSKLASPEIDHCPTERPDCMDTAESPSSPDVASMPTCQPISVEAHADWNKQDLKPCPHCRRTFLPDRLEVHLRSCRSHSPRQATNCGKDIALERHGNKACQHELASNLQQNAWLERWREEMY